MNGGPVERAAHANGDVAKEGFAFVCCNNAIIIFPRLGGILWAPSGIGAHHWFRRVSGESVNKGPGDMGAILGPVKLMKGDTQITDALETFDKALGGVKVAG